jgi:hypothetical protein
MEPLTAPAVTTLPADRLIVSLGRMTLASGTTLPAYLLNVPQLLVVERGDLDLEVAGEEPPILRGIPRATDHLTEATLEPGNGALLHAHSIVTLNGASKEPVTIFVVAILPAAGA